MEQNMSASVLAQLVTKTYPDVKAEVKQDIEVVLRVPSTRIRDVVRLIDERLPDVFPETVFGVDLQNDKFELIYYFWARDPRILCQIRVELNGPHPSVQSVADIFPGLEWHERETCEMFGIDFEGHPDMRPLLLPDELVGKYPLRKSFQTDRSRLEESGLPTRGPGGGE